MREKGVLGGVQRTGKGGYQWVYSPAMSEAEFKQHIARIILKSLLRDFPEETLTALENLEP